MHSFTVYEFGSREFRVVLGVHTAHANAGASSVRVYQGSEPQSAVLAAFSGETRADIKSQIMRFLTPEMARKVERNTAFGPLVQNSALAPSSDSGADSAAVAVNSGGATSPQVLEHDRYKVTIREDRMSGWFELDGEAIGGLIFGALTSKEPGAIELTDYDGVFALPSWVARMLREMGVHVDMTFCKE